MFNSQNKNARFQLEMSVYGLIKNKAKDFVVLKRSSFRMTEGTEVEYEVGSVSFSGKLIKQGIFMLNSRSFYIECVNSIF